MTEQELPNYLFRFYLANNFILEIEINSLWGVQMTERDKTNDKTWEILSNTFLDISSLHCEAMIEKA